MFQRAIKWDEETPSSMAARINNGDRRIIEAMRNGRVHIIGTIELMYREAKLGNPEHFNALVNIGKAIESAARYYAEDPRFTGIKLWNENKKGYNYLIHEVAKAHHKIAKETVMHQLAETRDANGESLIGIMVRWEHKARTDREIQMRKDITKNKLVL